MTRPAGVTSLVFTEEEVAKLEQAMVEEIDEGNAPTAKDAPAEYVIPKNIKPEYLAGGGVWRLQPRLARSGQRGDARERRAAHLADHHAERPAAGAQGRRDRPRPRPSQPAFVKLLGASPTPRGGSFDNPESRGAGERCIISFGRNGGPPMFPNGFYNNNYQIVQTPDAVVIEDRDGPRRADRAAERQAPHRRRAPLFRRLDRLVGRRHAGGRDHQHPAEPAVHRARGRT